MVLPLLLVSRHLLLSTKYYSKYWGLVLLLAPFILRILPIDDIRQSKYMFVISACFLSLILWETPKLKDKIVPCFGYITIASFATIHWQFSFNVLTQWIAVSVGLAVVIQMISLLDWDEIKPFIMVTCLLQSIWFIVNYLGFDPYEYYLKNFTQLKIMKIKSRAYGAEAIIGSLGNNTLSGALIAATLPTLLTKRLWYYSIVPFIALYLSDSTMSALSAIAGIYLVLAINSKYTNVMSMFGGLSLFGLALYATTLPRNGFLGHSGRIPTWKKALTWNQDWNILWGRGVGSITDNFKHFYKHKPPYEQLHNEFLEVYIIYGLIGVGIMAYLFYRAIICKNKNAILYGCLGSLMVNSLGSFPFHIAPTALLGIILYAIIIKDQRREQWLLLHQKNMTG